MPPHPSPTDERLRDCIAKRMRMSPIDQPLMLMELLGRRSPAPAQDIARRILGNGWWAACSPATASPNIPQCLTIRALRLSWISAWDSNSLISSGNTPIRREASSWLPMLPVATISSLAGLPHRR